jgi:hypothetical protein
LKQCSNKPVELSELFRLGVDGYYEYRDEDGVPTRMLWDVLQFFLAAPFSAGIVSLFTKCGVV